MTLRLNTMLYQIDLRTQVGAWMPKEENNNDLEKCMVERVIGINIKFR